MIIRTIGNNSPKATKNSDNKEFKRGEPENGIQTYKSCTSAWMKLQAPTVPAG